LIQKFRKFDQSITGQLILSPAKNKRFENMEWELHLKAYFESCQETIFFRVDKIGQSITRLKSISNQIFHI